MKSFIRNGFIIAALVVGSLPLAGCISRGSDFWSVYTLARQSLNGGRTLSLDQVKNVPYATIGVQLGGSNQVLLVFATQEGDKQLWTSADHIAIEIRQGHVARTVGLPHNLDGVLQNVTAPGTSVARYDFLAQNLFGVVVTCNWKEIGPEDISILGTVVHTLKSEEQCQANRAQVSWSFENVYWRDPKADIVWQSVQHFHPDSAPLKIQMFRPPTGNVSQ